MSKKVQQFDNFVWIDLENPTEDEIKSTSFPFDIDENFIEDSLELGHLPKIERTPNYLFIILRAYGYNGSICATHFGVTVPPISVQFVPVISV